MIEFIMCVHFFHSLHFLFVKGKDLGGLDLFSRHLYGTSHYMVFLFRNYLSIFSHYLAYVIRSYVISILPTILMNHLEVEPYRLLLHPIQFFASSVIHRNFQQALSILLIYFYHRLDQCSRKTKNQIVCSILLILLLF